VDDANSASTVSSAVDNATTTLLLLHDMAKKQLQEELTKCAINKVFQMSYQRGHVENLGALLPNLKQWRQWQTMKIKNSKTSFKNIP
jgi:hypothetical protein